VRLSARRAADLSAEGLEEAVRAPYRLDLAEAVLACGNQPVITKSGGRRDDSARRYGIFFSTLVFAVARPSEEVREAADPSGAARGVAGRAAVRPWCSTSLAAGLYVAACARRLSSTTLRLRAPGGPLGQRRSGCLDRRTQGCP
jgi:hypothetical protein